MADLETAAWAVVDDVWPWESDQSYGVSKAAILNLRRALDDFPADLAGRIAAALDALHVEGNMSNAAMGRAIAEHVRAALPASPEVER